MARRPAWPPAGLRPSASRVALQDSCHLRNGLGVWREPRELIAQVADYVELPSAAACCGAAGTYATLRPRDSAAVLEPKLDEIAAAEVDYVAIVNPGCLRQLRAGLRRRGPRTGAPSTWPSSWRAGLMQALVVEPGRAHSARVEEVPEPRREPGTVLLRPLEVGVCGTDREIAEGCSGSRPTARSDSSSATRCSPGGGGRRGLRARRPRRCDRAPIVRPLRRLRAGRT